MDKLNKPNDDGKGGPPKKKDEDALDKYKENELDTRWKEFVHRARVHEMLKCLQSEHKKLQILRDNINFDDMLPHEAEADETNQPRGSDFKKKSTGSTGKDTNVLFARNKPAADEQESATEVTPHTKKVSALSHLSGEDEKSLRHLGSMKANPFDLFKNKNSMTDKEFEEILELCDDNVEQQALRDAFEEKKNRDKYLHNADEMRQMLYDFINSQFFVQFMLITIIVSIVGIFLMTFEKISVRFAFPLMILDSCIIAIFVVEAVFKIVIYGQDYFKQVWNILDMLIIIVFMVEVTVDLITKTLALSADISSNLSFKFLKSLRALRLIRIIKFLPNLQVVVATVFQSMLSMGSIAVLMVLFIFVFAVMGRGLFFEDSPVHFGTILLAFVTLFQLLTLDDWFELLDDVKGKDLSDNSRDNKGLQYWFMFTYLFCYIVIEYFVFLNLFVAVLVDNFQLTLADAEVRKKKESEQLKDEQQKYEEQTTELDKRNEIDVESKNTMNPNKMELNVEDYFPVTKGSKDAQLLADIFKDMNSLDFQRFLWKRRVTLMNMVIDQALTAQRNTWSVQDAESMASKRKTADDKV